MSLQSSKLITWNVTALLESKEWLKLSHIEHTGTITFLLWCLQHSERENSWNHQKSFRLDGALKTWWRCSCPCSFQKSWTRRYLIVPSNPNNHRSPNRNRTLGSKAPNNEEKPGSFVIICFLGTTYTESLWCPNFPEIFHLANSLKSHKLSQFSRTACSKSWTCLQTLNCTQ